MAAMEKLIKLDLTLNFIDVIGVGGVDGGFGWMCWIERVVFGGESVYEMGRMSIVGGGEFDGVGKVGWEGCYAE